MRTLCLCWEVLDEALPPLGKAESSSHREAPPMSRLECHRALDSMLGALCAPPEVVVLGGSHGFSLWLTPVPPMS